MADAWRVLLVERDQATRDKIREELARDPTLTLEAETGDEVAAVMLAEQHKFDIVLLELALRKFTAATVATLVRKSCPLAKIILLTDSSLNDMQAQAPSLSFASAFLSKDEIPTRLLPLLRSLRGSKDPQTQ